MPRDSPLHKASYKGDLAAVQLLAQGRSSGERVDVNASGAQGRRPLHRAVGAERLEVARFLLENGADPNIQVRPREPKRAAETDPVPTPPPPQDGDGQTPLHWVAIVGNAKLVAMLLDHEGAIDAKQSDVSKKEFLSNATRAIVSMQSLGSVDVDLYCNGVIVMDEVRSNSEPVFGSGRVIGACTQREIDLTGDDADVISKDEHDKAVEKKEQEKALMAATHQKLMQELKSKLDEQDKELQKLRKGAKKPGGAAEAKKVDDEMKNMLAMMGR